MGKVFIIEPSEEQQEAIGGALGDAHELQFCRDVHSARAALANFGPDVLVLGLYDMEGLVFLQELGADRPGVVVCTPFLSEHITNHLQSLCDCIMYSPCDIRQLADHVNDLLFIGPQAALDDDSALAFVRQLLHRPARTGYSYLISAIRLYIRDPRQAVTKELYPAVAKQFGSNAACVEKAIRTAIVQAYENRDDDIWRRYFPIDRTGQVIKPTNKAFFNIAAAHIMPKRRNLA